jgi:hypothetical protein
VISKRKEARAAPTNQGDIPLILEDHNLRIFGSRLELEEMSKVEVGIDLRGAQALYIWRDIE